MDDPTYFAWGTTGGFLMISHAPCGEELLPRSVISLTAPEFVAAVNGHQCPGIVAGPSEGAEGN